VRQRAQKVLKTGSKVPQAVHNPSSGMGSTGVRILGPPEVDGGADLGGPKQRALLVLLAIECGKVVGIERITESLWGEAPPPTAPHAIQVYVSSLRKSLPSGIDIARAGGGYRLDAPEGSVDAEVFKRLAKEGHRLLEAGDAGGASTTLAQALSLWRGPIEGTDPELARLEELAVSALEDRFAAELDLGEAGALVPELESAVRHHPLRERLRTQLMQALYRSGRQADALAAYRSARNELLEQLGLEPGDELRNLHAAILRRDAALTVEPAELRARRKLPGPSTKLVGRRREVEEVAEALREDARLVTVVGPGGIGKTRVALQAAYELAEHFTHGVVFVGLGALRDPELVMIEVAAALGLESDSSVLETITDRQLLLLLDNFEQVDDAATELAPLLLECPKVRLLVTSRRPLRLYGEVVYPLAPLDSDDATALFVERANARRRGFNPTDRVRELCERLERLPLAIELVAARVSELSLAEMLDTLPRLELASEGPRDAPERHRSLRNAISWSYDLLQEGERAAIARLSVFAGMFTEAAALRVCDVARSTLASLEQHSLLFRSGDRFGMLETIRDFAGEQLPASDESHRRHAEYFRDLAHSSVAVRRTEKEFEWMDEMERDRDNVRAALSWWLEHDSAEALGLADASYRFWYIRGHHAEGARAFQLAVAAHKKADPRTRATATMYLAAFEFALRRLDEAQKLAEQVVDIWRQVDEPGMAARGLVLLATVRSEQGAKADAVKLVEEAIKLAHVDGDQHLIAFTRSHLAHATLYAEQYERAREAASEAIALLQEVGDTDGVRSATENLAAASLALDDDATAAESFGAALDLAQSVGNPLGIADNLAGLAAVAARRGSARVAARILGAHAVYLEERVLAPEAGARELQTQAEAAAIAALGEEEFGAAKAEGAKLSVDDAAREAREAVRGAGAAL
jgi:predicted ATPase/DNA-binding SARP family transcriptional activator